MISIDYDRNLDDCDFSVIKFKLDFYRAGGKISSQQKKVYEQDIFREFILESKNLRKNFVASAQKIFL